MPKTLAASLPKLSKDLFEISRKAAYDAYKTTQESGNSDAGIQSRMDIELEKAAIKFSNQFAQSFATDAAQAIYDFTKEIGIMLTMPSTLMTSFGPVSGMVPTTGFKIL